GGDEERGPQRLRETLRDRARVEELGGEQTRGVPGVLHPGAELTGDTVEELPNVRTLSGKRVEGGVQLGARRDSRRQGVRDLVLPHRPEHGNVGTRDVVDGCAERLR